MTPNTAPTGSALGEVLGLVEARRRVPLTVVGIGGRGASGKTTLARLVAASVPGTQVVATDGFWDGSGFDLARLRREVLDVVRAGRTALVHVWDFAAQRPGGSVVYEPQGVLVIDGVCALHRMFRDALDVAIWVDAPATVRLARAVARDGEASRARWVEEWMPGEDRYVAADDPVAAADLVVDGTRPFTQARSG